MKAAKVHIKIFINITANIALFITYAYLFGEQSVDKYLDNGVSIITQEETPLFITMNMTFLVKSKTPLPRTYPSLTLLN